MGKAKAITIQLQELVIREVQRGSSHRVVANQFGVSKAGVTGIMKRFQQRGAVVIKKSTGRPKKTTVKQDRILIKLSKEDPRKSAIQLLTELREKYQVNVSVDTVKRRLRSVGLYGRRPAKKPLISVKNRIARVQFANKHIKWTSKDWSKVLWSDESKFLLFGSDGIKYIRRPVGQRFHPKYQLPTVKHGGGNVMVWGCFSRDTIGPLHRIEGIMDQVLYKDIVNKVMLPHAKEKMPRGWIFQQDNDPKHTARSVKDFFQAKKIRLMEWPSQSPDLNPIEHLWEHLDRQLKGRKPRNQTDLFKMLDEAWAQIDIKVLINLVDSLPQRCRAVIAAKGYATKY